MSQILVVDDDAATAQLIQDVLVDEGHLVEIAHNGVLGIELMRVRLPDVVLVDQRMPVMDGIAFLKACRQETSWSAVRIVLVSAQAEQVSGAAGFDGFLANPFDVVDLLKTVEADHQAARASSSSSGVPNSSGPSRSAGSGLAQK